MDYSSVRVFLPAVVGLFDHIFKAIMGVPVLRFLMVMLLFLTILAFLSWLVRLGRTRKL